MEGDRQTSEKIIGPEDDLPDSSNVLQSSGIRRIISCGDAVDRVFLGNGFNLLFHICPIFWLILLFKSK
jgi:hypothetical protein